MKKQTKVLLTMLCAVLLVVGSVMGTLAYLTDQESVKNTFTVGQVAIDLNETDVDKDGSTKANVYDLLPGHTYKKDPTVTVLEGSDESYVRMIVKVSNYQNLKDAFPKDKVFDGEKVYEKWYATIGGKEVFLLQNLVTDWDATKWECVSVSDDGVYEFRYTSTVSEADGELEPLFKNVVIPGSVNNTELAKLQGFTITVEAHAIQAAGFNTAAEAWTAFGVQHP